MKKIVKKILFPNPMIGFFLFHLGACLLIYVFLYHLEETILAYISYFLSFYALVIFGIWFYKVCRFSNEWIKRSNLYHIYQKNTVIMTKLSMYFSFILNFIYGVLKFGIGIYYHSIWLITIAIYYLLLCVMRISLVRNIDNSKKEYQKLKHTGMILLFLNLILIGIIILIIKQNQVMTYQGFLIYFIALYDFYLIISATIKVIKYRKNHSPIILASKCVNLTVAMISMISLEVAMVTEFGNNDLNFKNIMTSSMGFVICMINSFMAIYMIIKANRNCRNHIL